MATSEKQKEYVKAHQAEKCDAVTVRPPKGTKALWRAAAEAAGKKSMQQFIIDTMNAEAEKYGLTAKSDT